MDFSKGLITLGLGLAVLGLALKFAPWLLNWFGKLPGDIRYEGEHSFVFIPLTSMLLLSAVASIVWHWFMRR